LPHPQEHGDRGFSSGSFLTTIKDSQGNFASRSVITLNADHTLSAADSNQGGPTFYFSTQMGTWKAAGDGRIVARVVNMTYPPSPGMARSEYTITLAPDGREAIGAITVFLYPLDANPLQDPGTLLGDFTFVGEAIKP
jgi:hypothetical protein